MKLKDIIDWWKNGTDIVEKILSIMLILSVLCMIVGIVGSLFIND